MKRRSFISLFGLAAVPQVALARPRLSIMEPADGASVYLELHCVRL